MSSIPLDLQRKCEQRWRARFAQPARSGAPQGHEVDSQKRQPAKTEKKSDRVEAAGLKSAPAA
jgi:hypothetical protein